MRKNNNFDLLRLVLATLVVYSHSFAMLGLPEPQIWGHTFGGFAVECFFSLSGYLIAKSWTKNPMVTIFAWHRFLRIVPGVVAAVLLSRSLWLITQYDPILGLGTFWTLPWEVVCYIGCAICGVWGVLSKRYIGVLVMMAWGLFVTTPFTTSPDYGVILPLALLFMMGSFIAIHEDSIRMSSAAVFGTIALCVSVSAFILEPALMFLRSDWFRHAPALDGFVVHKVLYYGALPFLLIYLGRHTKPVWQPNGDISYGIYLYGWTVQVLLVYLGSKHQFAWSVPLYFVTSIAITAVIATASWLLLERPALKLKSIFEVADVPVTPATNG